MCTGTVKFVSKILFLEQMENWFWCCTGHAGVHQWWYWLPLDCDNSISPGYEYNPETKAVITVEFTIIHQTKKQDKLNLFFNYYEVVCHNYTPEDQTVNKQNYLEVKFYLHSAVQCKRPDLYLLGDLLSTNCKCHMHKSIVQKNLMLILSLRESANNLLQKCRSNQNTNDWIMKVFRIRIWG